MRSTVTLVLLPILMVLSITGCSDARSGLEGVWRDDESSTLYTIAREGEGYTVTSSIDDDGEVNELSDVIWEDGVLKWTVLTPSTGYIVHFTTVSLRGDELETAWSGTAGSGIEFLRRQ